MAVPGDEAGSSKRIAPRRSGPKVRPAAPDSFDGLRSRSLVEAYLNSIADTNRSQGSQIRELQELIRQFSPEDLAGGVEKAALTYLTRAGALQFHIASSSRWSRC